MAKKVALVIAHEGYQPIEYGVPKEALENVGIEVVTVSNKPGIARATDDSMTQVDATVGQIKAEDFSGIFLIGGSGALENIDIPETHTLMQDAARIGIPYGAICIATRILAAAHVLHEKRATGWNNDDLLHEILKTHNSVYVDQDVVVDGDVVTATGPATAQEFAREIIKLVA